jgi:aspartyl-tRNA(Asn)/glutamyl-tRNA(Gln) amidotransferase subunit C
MTKINIHHIAKLTSLTLTDEEEKMLEGQLEKTLEHVDRLSEIDTSSVEVTNDITGLSNVMREDIVTPSLTQAEALMNAKQVHNGFFVVPVIIEEAVE